MRTGRHGYGNATLSRLQVLDSESVDLSVRGREPRVALRVVVGHDELKLTTLNVHLGLAPGERRRQLRQLLPALYQEDAPGQLSQVEPLVMGGDFNDFPPGPVTFTLRHRLIDAGSSCARDGPSPPAIPSCDSTASTSRPRFVACRCTSINRSSRAPRRDHLPLVVDAELPPPAVLM